MHFKAAITSGLVLAGCAVARADHESGSSNTGAQNAGYGSSASYTKTTTSAYAQTTGAAQSSGAYSAGSYSAGSSPYASSYASSSWPTSASTWSAYASASASASAPAASGSTGTKVHVVKVGGANGELVFSPSEVKAAMGDVVQFQFYPRNHSVVQSTFDQPCLPIGKVQTGMMGLFSGFRPVSADSPTAPVFTVPINDTKPIWFYCSQARHCQMGMVGVINPPANNASRTLDAYRKLAAQASQNVTPDHGINSGSGSPTSSMTTSAGYGSSSAATPPPSVTGKAGTNITSPIEANDAGSHLRSAGGLSLLGAAGAVALFLGFF